MGYYLCVTSYGLLITICTQYAQQCTDRDVVVLLSQVRHITT